MTLRFVRKLLHMQGDVECRIIVGLGAKSDIVIDIQAFSKIGNAENEREAHDRLRRALLQALETELI